ncbi:MAG: HEAT repeat domain-containing protein [Planctomycetota bacterium]
MRLREAETMIQTGWFRWVVVLAASGMLSAAGCGTSRGKMRNWREGLHSPDRLVRLKAVSVAAQAPRKEAVGPLIERLEDEDDVVRTMAYEALVRVSGEKLPFDPLGNAFERREQVEEWKGWAKGQGQGGGGGS